VRGFLIVLAAVLVAVGIGIGAEGVAGPQVYGPPGARFTAAFPTAPSATAIVFHGGGGSGEQYRAQLGEDALTVRITVLPRRAATLAFSPYGSGVTAGALIEQLHPPAPLFFRRLRVAGRRASVAVSCAAAPALGRPACAGVLLAGEVGASHGFAVGLAATATGATGAVVRALLMSVTPIGREPPLSAAR
jgi:hypothetical protein